MEKTCHFSETNFHFLVRIYIYIAIYKGTRIGAPRAPVCGATVDGKASDAQGLMHISKKELRLGRYRWKIYPVLAPVTNCRVEHAESPKKSIQFMGYPMNPNGVLSR